MRTPPLRAPIEGLTIYPVRSDDDAAAAIGWLAQGHPIVAVDTETTGLDYHAEVRLVQLGDYQVAWVGGGRSKVHRHGSLQNGHRRVPYSNPVDV